MLILIYVYFWSIQGEINRSVSIEARRKMIATNTPFRLDVVFGFENSEFVDKYVHSVIVELKATKKSSIRLLFQFVHLR